MAILSNQQAAEVIKKPTNTVELKKAVDKKYRNNLHTEAVVVKDAASIYKAKSHLNFLSWVETLLGQKQNYERYRALYKPPVATNELTESIFQEFRKIFDSQDPFSKFVFNQPELEQDFAEYRNSINDKEFMEQKGFSTFKSSIDSFLVVDMKSVQMDENGLPIVGDDDDPLTEPYPYIVDIEKVVDVQATRNVVKSMEDRQEYSFAIEYFVFHETANKIIVIDDIRYMTFVKNENDSDFIFESEFIHDLGFCPVKSFYNTPLNEKADILKLNPIDKSLSELDWLLFWKLARKYLELYAPFPIIVKFKERCNYIDQEHNARCKQGIIEYKDLSTGDRKMKVCPSCSEKIAPGPGNVTEVDVPQDKDDVNLIANSVNIVGPDEVSLNYVKAREEELEQSIFYKSVGRGQDMQNNQAQNELQVKSQYESRHTVLMGIKTNFEIVHFFMLDTMARLRYGDAYQGGVLSYGTEFFIKDVHVQEEEYENAKKNGLPMHELKQRRSMIYQTKYKNNPDKLMRIEILSQLEPYPDLTIAEMTTVNQLAPLRTEDVLLKINFNNLIDRFEREQSSILQFGSALDMDRRIQLIREELQSYIAEMYPEGDDGGGQGSRQDIEAQARANLKGSVGGIQGVLSIQQSVVAGTTPADAAVAVMKEFFGFDDAKARSLLPDPNAKPPAPTQLPPTPESGS